MTTRTWNHFEQLRAVYRMRSSLSYVEFSYCIAMLDHADHVTGDTYVGPDKIAQETGYSVRHIETAAAEMKRRGMVSIVEIGRRGHRGVLRLNAANAINSGVQVVSDSPKPVSVNDALNSPKPTSVHQPDSPKCSARFTEVQPQNRPKPTSVSSTQLSTHRSNRRCATGSWPAEARAESASDHPKVVKAFCDAWRTKYKAEYRFAKAKDGAMIKRLLGDAGNAGEAIRIVAAYFADPDPWLTQQAHPLGVLVSKLNTYRARLSGGPCTSNDGSIDFENTPGPFKAKASLETIMQIEREAQELAKTMKPTWGKAAV